MQIRRRRKATWWCDYCKRAHGGPIKPVQQLDGKVWCAQADAFERQKRLEKNLEDNSSDA